MSMRVLIACEFSGVVREAFNVRSGIHAQSCDLLPAEDGRSDCHYRADVRHILDRGWDLMIAHPPCTYLCNSGVRWIYDEDGAMDGARWDRMIIACEFFNALLGANIPRICVENPVMHGYARQRINKPYAQTIQPWQFGHGEIRRTCLWLKNLPPLRPTQIVDGREARVHRASPGPERWKERSRTLPGIAGAMAEQWGNLCK